MNQVISFYKGKRFRKAELYIEDFQSWKGRKFLSSKNFQTKACILKAKYKHNCNRTNANSLSCILFAWRHSWILYNVITFGLLVSLLFQDSIYGTAEDSILLASLPTLQRKYLFTFPRWKPLISFREKIWTKNISQTWQIFDWMLVCFFLRPCFTFDLTINSFLTSFAMGFYYCLLQKIAVKFDPLNKLFYYIHCNKVILTRNTDLVWVVWVFCCAAFRSWTTDHSSYVQNDSL